LDAGGTVLENPGDKALYIQIPITEALDWWDEREKRDLAREIIDTIKSKVNLSSGGNPDGFKKLLNAVGIDFRFTNYPTLRSCGRIAISLCIEDERQMNASSDSIPGTI
jgi:hypothetical protein